MTAPRIRRRCAGDRGAAQTLTIVLLFPVTALLLFAGVQTVLWQHARTIATDRADQIVAQIAAGALTPAQASAELTAALRAERDLRRLTIAVDRNARLSSVLVTADVPGILLGTHTRISVRAGAPTEGWQPLP